MSAYFCSDAVFKKAVTAILQYVDEFDGIRTYRTSPRDALPNEAQLHAGTMIGRRLKRMNKASLEQRYPGQSGVTKDDLRFQLDNYVIGLCPVALFQALDCISYQCCEGKVPESRRYKELERVMGVIAGHVVRQSPEWNWLPWGD